jgi:Cu+-exporting ATPase
MASATAKDSSEESGDELLSLKIRLAVGLLFSTPLLVLMILRLAMVMPPEWVKWLELALATVVFFYCGYTFHVRGLQSWIRQCPPRLNMFTLINLGTSVAYFYSVVACIFPGPFTSEFRDPETGEIMLFFDAAAIIITVG